LWWIDCGVGKERREGEEDCEEGKIMREWVSDETH
jgi:hypothetical protein